MALVERRLSLSFVIEMSRISDDNTEGDPERQQRLLTALVALIEDEQSY